MYVYMYIYIYIYNVYMYTYTILYTLHYTIYRCTIPKEPCGVGRLLEQLLGPPLLRKVP